MSLKSDNDEQYATSRKLAARARLFEAMVAEEPWFSWVARRLPAKAADHILDIGCGPGWFWPAGIGLLPAGLALTLCDLSGGMVAEALQHGQDLPLASREGCVADAAALPFADQSFDGVIAMHMLYHVADPQRAIAEAHRVLKPGGFLAVTTNGLGDMHAIYELTTCFGGTPVNPAALAFGFAEAERLMQQMFGSVTHARHEALMHITSAEDIFLAMTSFPPGDRATDDECRAFRQAIDQALTKGGGVLTTAKQAGLFVSRKTSGGKMTAPH